jgi:hypothetical protein
MKTLSKLLILTVALFALGCSGSPRNYGITVYVPTADGRLSPVAAFPAKNVVRRSNGEVCFTAIQVDRRLCIKSPYYDIIEIPAANQ